MIFKFLCAPFLINAQTEQESIFAFADSLAKTGNFQLACIEYERICFTTDNPDTFNLALLQKSALLAEKKNFSEAVSEIRRTKWNEGSNTQVFTMRYHLALYNYFTGDFTTAESVLLETEYFTPDSLIPAKFYLLRALNANELHEYKAAQNFAWKYLNKLPLDSSVLVKKEKVKELYLENNLPQAKDPEKARKLSTFVPGLGQIYAGYPLEGIFNFTLHLATLGLAAYAMVNTYYLTGYFGGLALFQKFYFGSSIRAHYLAEKHNYLVYKKFNDQARKILLENSEK